MQLSKLSCGGLHGEPEKSLCGYCVRDPDVDTGNMRAEPIRTSCRYGLKAIVHRPGASFSVLPGRLLLNRAMADLSEVAVGIFTVGE